MSTQQQANRLVLVRECGCGNPCDHIVGRRLTADGIRVVLWSDGTVTGAFGFKLAGVPMVRARTKEAQELALRVGWLFLSELEIYDADNLDLLYKACRWAAVRDGLPGTARARLAHYRHAALKPVWTVESTDRDGQPTSRYWRLPRLIAPGVVVWDHVSVGASGGRYEIFYVVSGSNGETCEPSGIRFSKIIDVSNFILAEVRK